MRRPFSSALTALSAITCLAAAATASTPSAYAADSGDVSCQRQVLAVTLSAADATPYHLVGFLCAKGSPAGKPVQVLVHGLTYDHRYWDWPAQPNRYSYVRRAAGAGYATFAYDRIGDGQSNHPVDGTLLTKESSAFVLHEVIGDLRAGAVGGVAFGTVITVGHSFGSSTALAEAAAFHDEQGVIATGALHDVNPAFFVHLADLYPANQDPAFASMGFNDTYLTTRPGTRAGLFFDLATADPDVLALDEQIKQTATTGELATVTTPDTTLIDVPVLLEVGQTDVLFCNEGIPGFSCADDAAVLAREAAHYAPQSCLQAYVLAGSGHDINLHPNARTAYGRALDWADQLVRQGRPAGCP
jgi:pimeloyl-ACP methyl ester carboxylesterase